MTLRAKHRWIPRWSTLLLTLFFLQPLSAADTLGFGEMYLPSVFGTRFSPKTVALSGKVVTVTGFMAPLLRVQSDFFVLTRQPVSLCPFCNSDSDWPSDILVVYLRNGQIFRQNGQVIDVTGRLEMGSFTDKDTGFVSLLRIVDAQIQEH